MMPQTKSSKDSNNGRSQGISNPLNRIRNTTGNSGGNEYKYSGTGTIPGNDNSNLIFDGEEESKRERKDHSPTAGNSIIHFFTNLFIYIFIYSFI